MLDAVDDFIFFIHEDDVAVLSHQLNNQTFVTKVAHVVVMLYMKLNNTF